MNVINVLEMQSGVPTRIVSFDANDEESAEELFEKLISENDLRIDKDEIDFYLKMGSYDDKNGYEVHLIWSE